MTLRREVNVPIYWLVVGLAVMVVSPIFSVIAAVKISANQADHTREEQARAAAVTQAENRQVVCSWLSAYLDTFDETPPASDAGKNLRLKFQDLYRISQCPPR
jgi:Tfp pilus assembly protein PilX